MDADTNMNNIVKLLSNHGAIVTGSFALKSLGFFGENTDRIVHDIDLVFKTKEDFHKFVSKIPELTILKNETIDESPVEYVDDYYRLYLENETVKIDCFIRGEDIPYIKFDGIVYEIPRNIVKAKIDILFDRFMNVDDATYTKHKDDLHYIFELSRGFVDKTITL
ncbi:MAG: hypothetical protein WC679_01115 [Bacteroidales bacterium]